jgi:RNA polymerase sigma factor (sigma-70 family)
MPVIVSRGHIFEGTAMSNAHLSRAIQSIRSAAFPREEAGRSDGQLLESYIRSGEEVAFASLVHRHGPMVWGVCRRILPGHQDAEDAFQATFLVLVRKAASIVPRDMVANWLYGVANQTALKARAAGVRRRDHEKQVTAVPEPAIHDEPVDDLRPVLDRELSRLPDKYRAVIVLCDLEGKTRKEAARHFKLPEGTVATRLATARTMLARRLERSGLTVSGAALLTAEIASAGVPASLASTTIKAASLFAAGQAAAVSTQAVALAEGVLRTMLLTKLKWTTAVLLTMTILGGSAAVISQQVWAEKLNDPAGALLALPEEKPVSAPRSEPVRQPAAVKERAEPVPTVVRGAVKAVDERTRTITVTYGVGEGAFTVPTDVDIKIDGKSGKFAGIPVGANVVLTQFSDAQTPRTIQANGQAFFGAVVKAVDAERNTITIADRGNEQTFAVAQDACINADGKACKLADLPPGAIVNMGLLVDQATVCNIGAQGEHLGACGGSMVKAIDVANRTVTFDDKAVPDVAGKTFSVGKNANIIIDGKHASELGELPAGSYINITLSLDRQTVGTIIAQGPPVDCDCGGSVVKAIDVENRTITFADNARPTVAGKTFTIAKNANIVIDGGAGKLADLPPGALVNLRLQVDQKTVGTVHACGSGISGTVQAVDLASNSITVDASTYVVARDALIVVNGQQGPLASLTTGAGVNMTLRVDQKTVGMIQTK